MHAANLCNSRKPTDPLVRCRIACATGRGAFTRRTEGALSPWEMVGDGTDARPDSFKLKPPEPKTEEKKP
jgi:hypothetical protein